MAYSALESQHIRVLKLEPSSEHDAVIVCSMSMISLEGTPRPQYEALSYVWGDLSERQEIHLDGQPTPVTRNLWTALRYIRRSDISRTLWVDAICINQSDVQERNAQICQMGRIYNQASPVLIWLGDADPQIEDTFAALSLPRALEGRKYQNFPSDIAAGLRKMLMRPWWHRIWVLQEHVLASADPVVGCGQSWLGWEELSSAVMDYMRSRIAASGTAFVNNQSTWIDEPFTVMRRVLLRKEWNDTNDRDGTGAGIAKVVEQTRGCGSTDKRDQIFSVRDLLREEDKFAFPAPDYTRSVGEVYQEATVALIRNSRNPTFLIHAISEGDEDLGLPSWCVDFSKRMWDWGTYEILGGHDLAHCEGMEKATQQFMSVFSHDVSLGTLRVLGGALGQVILSRPLVPPWALDESEVAVRFEDVPQLITGNKAKKLIIFIEFVKEVLFMTTTSYQVWEKRHGAQTAKERIAAGQVWETLFGGVLFTIVDAVCIQVGIETVDGDDRPREYWVVEAFIRKLCPWYVDAIGELGFLHPTLELVESDRLERALWETVMFMAQSNTCKGWFKTDTGYIGRVNRELEEGDQLCSIRGCEGPFILRSVNDGFKLICLPQSEDFIQDHHYTHVDKVKWEVFTLY